MNLETFTVGAAFVLYLLCSLSYSSKQDWLWALVWFAYAVANLGLILAAKK
jgi:hypothetical protein